jgi:hypothetical protein
MGQPCCATRTCTAAGTGCFFGGAGICYACGNAGQPCCPPDRSCATGSTCSGGNPGICR